MADFAVQYPRDDRDNFCLRQKQASRPDTATNWCVAPPRDVLQEFNFYSSLKGSQKSAKVNGYYMTSFD